MTHSIKYYALIFLTLSVGFTGCFTDSSKKFQLEMAVKADTLNIDNTSDTVITGSKGTTIFLPKNIFTFSDGTIPKGNTSLFN